MQIEITIRGGATVILNGNDAEEMYGFLGGFVNEPDELDDPNTTIEVSDGVHVVDSPSGRSIRL